MFDELPRPRPPFERIDSYDPDDNPSFSQVAKDRQGDGHEEVIRYFLVVRGIGVLIVKMSRKDRSIVSSVIEKSDLGYSPTI